MKIYFLLTLFSFTTVFAKDIKTDVEEIIKSEFTQHSEINFVKYTFPIDLKSHIENQVRQKFFDTHVYIWKICSEDSLKGYAVLDNTYGKSLPITFLVIFSPTGNIIRVNVIRYREPYGGAIGSRNWLDQFINKSHNDFFRVDKEIDSITGATISVNSVTRGIHKLSLLINRLISDKIFSCSFEHKQTEPNSKISKK